jgi:2-iminobutanoate/2-iminopropanoate deaminase
MLASAGSDLDHVVHVNVFLKDMADFEPMNAVYADMMGKHRPARTVVGVRELPKSGALLTMNLSGALLTMNLTAVTRT